MPPSPELVRFVRVSVVIVGKGHCLKATKTSVLTEPSREELVNTSQGHYRSQEIPEAQTLMSGRKHQAILRRTETLPGPFGVRFEG